MNTTIILESLQLTQKIQNEIKNVYFFNVIT